jgi:hypothetical protein
VIKALSQIKKEIVAKVIEDDDAVREFCCFFPRFFT